MWFRFPQGVTEISVNLQNFFVEATSEDGSVIWGYFRAPEHFAPAILSVPGFIHAIPPGDLPDLPSTQVTQAVGDLASQLAAKQKETDELRSSLSDLQAAFSVVMAQREDLKVKLNEAEAKISQLENPEVFAGSGVEVETGVDSTPAVLRGKAK